MTSSSESNSTTDSAPPSSGSAAVAGTTSTKCLTSSSQCHVNSSNFFASPESESRCCCTNCHLDMKVATPDVCESPKSPEIVSPITTLKHAMPTGKTNEAKRSRVDCDADTSQSNKKKRKFSSILKGMMSPTKKPLEVDKDRDAVLRGLGGGIFEKVAKI